jgi:hypothetical protein
MYARKLLLLQSVSYSQYITSCVNEVTSSCRIKVASSNNHIGCDVTIIFLQLIMGKHVIVLPLLQPLPPILLLPLIK